MLMLEGSVRRRNACRRSAILGGNDGAAKAAERGAQTVVGDAGEAAVETGGGGCGNGAQRRRRGRRRQRQRRLDQGDARYRGAAEKQVDALDDERRPVLYGERRRRRDAQAQAAAAAERFGPGGGGELRPDDLAPPRLQPGEDAAAAGEQRRGDRRGRGAERAQAGTPLALARPRR